ncbi:MAG: hypothetical protein V7L25_31540 [Nostoc sp.]|uniref:hypothetical protein n=1 Tax=Nostoc sp. TaxID=1180 RepID=UPI002FF25F39
MVRLKKVIAKSRQCDRSSSSSVPSAPLWFVKKSDRTSKLPLSGSELTINKFEDIIVIRHSLGVVV